MRWRFVGKAKVWPYLAANLIYTFSCRSIGSCHVCTTWAVCLCVGSLWPLCRERPTASRECDICFCREYKGQRGYISSGIQFIHYKRSRDTHQQAANLKDPYMCGFGNKNIYMSYFFKYAWAKPRPGNGHLKVLWQLLTGFTLIINQGHQPTEAYPRETI